MELNGELQTLAGGDVLRRKLLAQTARLLESLQADSHARVLHSSAILAMERGRLALTHDDVGLARRELETGLSTLRVLHAEDTGDGGLAENLAIALSELGEVARDQGRLAEARDHLEEAIAMLQAMTKSTGAPRRWAARLATAFERLGEVMEMNGDLAQAKQNLVRAVELRREVRKKEELDATVDLFELAQRENEREQADQAAHELADLLERIDANDPLKDDPLVRRVRAVLKQLHDKPRSQRGAAKRE